MTLDAEPLKHDHGECDCDTCRCLYTIIERPIVIDPAYPPPLVWASKNRAVPI